MKHLLVLALSIPLFAQAHTRSESHSQWRIDDNRATAVINISEREVTRLPGGHRNAAAAFAAHIRQTVRVSDGGSECALQKLRQPLSSPGYVKLELEFLCASAPEFVDYRAIFDLVPAHVHFARSLHGGRLQSEQLITATSSRWHFRNNSSDDARPAFASWMSLGIQHIVSGVDHMAFLLGLLLLACGLRELIVAVSGFTIGHSLSLAAAVLGYVVADIRLVEAFVGLTVAIVAVEYFVRSRQTPTTVALAVALLSAGAVATAWLLLDPGWPYLAALAGMSLFAACYLRLIELTSRRSTAVVLSVTLLFGVIHGFGFAGFLIDGGVSGARLFTPLLGFNLGVEIGQVAAVGLMFGLGSLVQLKQRPLLGQWLAAGLCGLGVYWYLGRALN